MQSWYGDTGLVFYNNKDTINPFLTVRTADSLGAFFDDQWTPTRRLTINLGLRFDHMTSKYGTGKVYNFVSSPDDDQRPAPRAARPRRDRQHLRLQDVVTARRAELHAHGGRQDRGARRVRALLPAGQRRVPETVRSRHAAEDPDLQIFLVGPWSTVDTNGDGKIDSLETRDAARRVHGLTPF